MINRTILYVAMDANIVIVIVVVQTEQSELHDKV